jgi:hypothetical protein
MHRRIKLAVVAVLALLCLSPALPAYAQPVDVFKKACETGGSSGSEACAVSGADPITGANGTIGKVTQTIAYIAGAAAVILFIIAGIMYVLSNGDASKVVAAKNTFLYALIGLVIVIFAQAIIIFVINNIK